MVGRRQVIVDPTLGELHRRGGFGRGVWRGTIELQAGQAVPLALPGGRQAPDPAALALAGRAAELYRLAGPDIAAALADHAEPYGADATALAPLAPIFVHITSLDGHDVVEFGFRVPWDDDHLLGARVRDGRLVELNGSVLEP